jgi:hypothetical protein
MERIISQEVPDSKRPDSKSTNDDDVKVLEQNPTPKTGLDLNSSILFSQRSSRESKLNSDVEPFFSITPERELFHNEKVDAAIIIATMTTRKNLLVAPDWQYIVIINPTSAAISADRDAENKTDIRASTTHSQSLKRLLDRAMLAR